MRDSLRTTLLAIIALAVTSTALAGPPRSLAVVTDEHISDLEQMHQAASDLLIQNDFEGALRAYSDIILFEPDDETAYTGMGQIYLIKGQSKKAHEAFQNALQIDPRNEVALAGIQKIMDPDGVEGMTSSEESRQESKPQMLKTIVKIDPGHKAWMPNAGRLAPMKQKSSVRTPGVGRVGRLHAQRVQMALKNAGVYQGRVNGMVGKNTKQALRYFQKMRGLRITGTINTATWNYLAPYLDPARK